MRSIAPILAVLLLRATPLVAQTADDIISKYIARVGGIEKIQAARSVRRSGTFIGGGGFEAHVVQENRRPNLVREEFSLQGMTAINAYDGTTGCCMPFSIESGRKGQDKSTVRYDKIEVNVNLDDVCRLQSGDTMSLRYVRFTTGSGCTARDTLRDSIRWGSSDPGVATVSLMADGRGLLRASANGTFNVLMLRDAYARNQVHCRAGVLRATLIPDLE